MARLAFAFCLLLALLATPAVAAPKDRQPAPDQPPIFKWLFKPNLVIESIEVVELPGGIVQNQHDYLELRVRVRNTGVMPAAPCVVGAWAYIDGQVTSLFLQPLPLMMGGGSYDLTFSLGAVKIDTEQAYIGMAYADLFGQVTESNENDNLGQASATL